MKYFIPEGNLSEFEKRITKMIRRAAKLNAKLEYVVNRNEFSDVKFEFTGTDGVKTEKYVRHIAVTVDGDRPKFAGWNFIGTLEHTDEGNVLRMVPGELAPERYRDQPPVCEHCKLKRTRRDTFLVRHETGTVSQVGSNCLRDFLGHENPHYLAQLSTIWVQVEDLSRLAEQKNWLGGGGGLGSDRNDLMLFLSYVAEITMRHGFVSRAMVNAIQEKQGPNAHLPETTSHRAQRYMLSTRDWKEAQGYEPTEAAKEMAEKARSWALAKFGVGLPDGDDDTDSIKSALVKRDGHGDLSDFEQNLFVVAKGESVERRTFWIAAYLIQAYRKDNNLIPNKPARKPSEHIGTVGQRFKKIQVNCVKVITWDSQQFGWAHLFKLEVNGGLLVWRTYNVSDENLMVEGKSYEVNCTVKKHGVYNMEKQTEVSRLKVVTGLLTVGLPVKDEAAASESVAQASASMLQLAAA